MKAEDHFYVKALCGERTGMILYGSSVYNKATFGLENLSLIPGTVGAAPVQNIGAYGVEVSEFLFELEALEIASTGKRLTFTKHDCQLSYRHSIFKAELERSVTLLQVLTFKLLKRAQPNLSYPALRDALKDMT